MAGVLADQMAPGAFDGLQLCGADGDCGGGISTCWGHPGNPQLAVPLQG